MGGATWLLVVASVAVAATAGVFVAFSTFVMRALGDLPPADAVRAMQALNRRAPSPAFMALLVGSTLLAVAGAVGAVVTRGPGSGCCRRCCSRWPPSLPDGYSPARNSVAPAPARSWMRVSGLPSCPACPR